MLGICDLATQPPAGPETRLIVVSVTADVLGGAEVAMSGGLRLEIFPDGSFGEDWRLIETDGDHVVVEAGGITIV